MSGNTSPDPVTFYIERNFKNRFFLFGVILSVVYFFQKWTKFRPYRIFIANFLFHIKVSNKTHKIPKSPQKVKYALKSFFLIRTLTGIFDRD